METYKILKLRAPMVLFSKYTLSQRKLTTLITSFPSHYFIYKSTHLWNTIQPQLKIWDFTPKIGIIKITLKKALTKNQHTHHDTEWLASTDFVINNLKFFIDC